MFDMGNPDDISFAAIEALTYDIPATGAYTLEDNILPPLWTPKHQNTRKPPLKSLGDLEVLPIELLHIISSQLDLATVITSLRIVNRRALEVIESMTQYTALTKYIPDVLRIVFKVETAQNTTCESLYKALCTAECEECGDFGGYLYIITCKRVCFLCFTEVTKYSPLPEHIARTAFGITEEIVETLPRMRSLAGMYSPHRSEYNRRSVLVDFEAAMEAGITRHGSWEAMEVYVAEEEPDFGYEAGGNTDTPFMAVVRAPWLNRANQEIDWGFHCLGCLCLKDHYEVVPPHMHSRRMFTMASFARHLKIFGSVKDGRHVSENQEEPGKFNWQVRYRCDCCRSPRGRPRSNLAVSPYTGPGNASTSTI